MLQKNHHFLFPETYFGSGRNEYLANGFKFIAGEQVFDTSTDIKVNKLYLTGKWNFDKEYAENIDAGSIIFRYNAKNVYFVASSTNNVTLTVKVDGKEILGDNIINDERLYNIVSGNDYGVHTLTINANKPGLRAFTFTFG